MPHPTFHEAMRRVITGEGQDGRSLIIVDGPPSGELGAPGLGGLYEIWHEALNERFDPKDPRDRGEQTPVLSPGAGHVKARWFVIEPPPEGAPPEAIKAAARERFAAFGAAHELRDQDRHPAMHQTETLDVICLISGEASLILDGAETRLRPGQIVIQRGTSHAWTAHNGPALFLAVLIDRDRRD
ncbi:MAG: cupin domain-containing protein [Hyphomonadaceae bacterium]|nr:cupin domain-containing protein [Hyphomonadaceae bacterium]